MQFAILIPVYNNLDYTKSTLKELNARISPLKDATFHIVLIDDGSTDGTSQWVEENHPEVVLLKGDGNLWWSGAINLGARHSIEVLKVDYLILWNNDIEIEPDYFQEVVNLAGQQETPAVLGSKIFVAEERDVVWSMGSYFDPRTGRNDMYGFFEKDREEYQHVREVDWITGMGTIIPAEVVQTIGYWDAINFPQYHGDGDFTYRAKLAGYKNLIYPSLKMYNHVGNSGVGHDGSFRKLVRMMTDVRSKSNLKKNLKFYRLYATSPRAYLPLVKLYFKIFGGFLKWKVLQLFGIKRKVTYT